MNYICTSPFLHKDVGQLLSRIPAHLVNTGQFLGRLRWSGLERNCVMKSLDVTVLYTNVDNNAALQALSGKLDKHEGGVVTLN